MATSNIVDSANAGFDWTIAGYVLTVPLNLKLDGRQEAVAERVLNEQGVLDAAQPGAQARITSSALLVDLERNLLTTDPHTLRTTIDGRLRQAARHGV